MDNNLAVSGLTFKLIFSDKNGSERREVSRGVNLPEVMKISHQNFVDSATKKAGVRSVLRFDRHLELADGSIAPGAFAYLVVGRLTDTGVTSADVAAVVERVVHTVQEDDSGLDLATAIYVNGEQ